VNEVTSGLSDGDAVIIPSDKVDLQDGLRVSIETE